MTGEELLELVGQVDDELIREAEEFRPAPRRGLPAWWRPLAGGAAACLLAAALFHLPQGGGGAGNEMSSSAPLQSGAGAGSAGGSGESSAGAQPQDVPQEGVYTPAGEYRLTGEIVSALPEDSRQLGVLFLEGEVSLEELYTQKREYAGCMLWEGPDGTLYVQLPWGGYALAKPV